MALSTCSNWSTNFIIGLITPPLVQDTGYGAYVFFAVFCLLSLVWTYVFVPETKGRTYVFIPFAYLYAMEGPLLTCCVSV